MNEKENHKIDELFSNKLKDLNASPSTEGRERILSAMLQQNSAGTSTTRKILYTILAAAIVSGIYFIAFNPIEESSSEIAVLENSSKQKDLKERTSSPYQQRKEQQDNKQEQAAPSNKHQKNEHPSSSEDTFTKKEVLYTNRNQETKEAKNEFKINKSTKLRSPQATSSSKTKVILELDNSFYKESDRPTIKEKTPYSKKALSDVTSPSVDKSINSLPEKNKTKAPTKNTEIANTPIENNRYNQKDTTSLEKESLAVIDEDLNTKQNEENAKKDILKTELSENNILAIKENNTPAEDEIASQKHYLIGIHYMPEIIFGLNNDDLPNNNFDLGHAGNISINHHKNGVVMQTGLGLAYYQKNINSILYYTPNNSSNLSNSTIKADTIVHAETQDTIIDESLISIQDGSFSSSYFGSISSKKSISRYTFLQIPFIFGYEHTHKKITTIIKSGPVFSFLIKKEEATYDNTTFETINLDHKTPLQVDINCLLELNIGITYSLSKAFKIGLEPTFRYYIASLSNSSEVQVKHPYSIGIRTGILYKL